MAALPKKKISKVRGKTRRGHIKATLAAVQIDPNTGTPRLSHRMAPDTGMYRGRVVKRTKLAKQLEKSLAHSKKSAKPTAAPKSAKAAPKKTATKTRPAKSSGSDAKGSDQSK